MSTNETGSSQARDPKREHEKDIAPKTMIENKLDPCTEQRENEDAPAHGFDRFLLILEYIYLLRFPLLSALLLGIGLPLGYYFAPSIFEGLFDAGGVWSFGFVVWMEFQLAWTIMVTSRLVLVYGPERFESLKRLGWTAEPLKAKYVFFFGLIPTLTFALTWYGSQDLEAWQKAIASLAGILTSIGILFLASFVHFRIEEGAGLSAGKIVPTFNLLKNVYHSKDVMWEETRSPFWNFMDWLFGHFSDYATAGLMRRGESRKEGPEKGKCKKWFRSGHEMAFTAFVLLLVVYGAIGLGYAPGNANPERQPAALFYALFLIMLCTWFFYGAAFLLDRWRLPVLTTLLIMSLLTGLIRTDHQYRVTRIPELPELSPAEVIEKWNAGPREGAGKPLIVVATAGGGIQAAAWTAQVLTGLQEDCSRFASSLVLVSSVSGGSVGTMYTVAPFDGKTGAYAADQLDPVRKRASRSSLSSVGWGLLYPDMIRTLPLIGWAVPQYKDRGSAIETAWMWDWDKATKPPMISQWRNDVANGTRPAVIFNATASESGQRFLVSTTELQNPGGLQFGRDYKGWDVPVATAARLSATFTYVSPVARATDANWEENRVHVADGGYYDNSGLVGALEWLREAKTSLTGRTVLLLFIDGETKNPAPGKAWSWQKQIAAPIITIMNMRTASQQYRANVESILLKHYLESRDGEEIKEGNNDAKDTGTITVIPVKFLYSGRTQPLSWHLTREQKDNIASAWNVRTGDLEESRRTVLEHLGCTVRKRTVAEE